MVEPSPESSTPAGESERRMAPWCPYADTQYVRNGSPVRVAPSEADEEGPVWTRPKMPR